MVRVELIVRVHHNLRSHAERAHCSIEIRVPFSHLLSSPLLSRKNGKRRRGAGRRGEEEERNVSQWKLERRGEETESQVAQREEMKAETSGTYVIFEDPLRDLIARIGRVVVEDRVRTRVGRAQRSESRRYRRVIVGGRRHVPPHGAAARPGRGGHRMRRARRAAGDEHRARVGRRAAHRAVRRREHSGRTERRRALVLQGTPFRAAVRTRRDASERRVGPPGHFECAHVDGAVRLGERRGAKLSLESQTQVCRGCWSTGYQSLTHISTIIGGRCS